MYLQEEMKITRKENYEINYKIIFLQYIKIINFLKQRKILWLYNPYRFRMNDNVQRTKQQ